SALYRLSETATVFLLQQASPAVISSSGPLARCQPLRACGHSPYGAERSKATVTFYAKSSDRSLRSKADKKEVTVTAQCEVDRRSSWSGNCGDGIEQT